MQKRLPRALPMIVALAIASPTVASADWLITGFVGPLTNTKLTIDPLGGSGDEIEGEANGGTGFGLNFAKAWATSGGTGFEFDWGIYPKFWGDSQGGESARLMTLSPNFFINPSIPRIRPYGVVGPTVSLDTLGEGTNTYFGANFGGGVIVFAGERGGVRLDARYFRQFGEGVSFRLSNAPVGNDLKNVSFWRFFVGGTLRIPD